MAVGEELVVRKGVGWVLGRGRYIKMGFLLACVPPNAEPETRSCMRLVLGNDPKGQVWGIEKEEKTVQEI